MQDSPSRRGMAASHGLALARVTAVRRAGPPLGGSRRLWVGALVSRIKEGIDMAAEVIEAGAALEKLEALAA